MARIYKTVKPSGGDYTALETCLNAQEQDLTDSGGDYLDVEIDGDWSSADTTAVVIHNYTTNATSYINIYTTATARHAGVWSTTKYRLIPATGSALAISEEYVRAEGLQLECGTGSGHGAIYLITIASPSDIRIGNCFCRTPEDSTNANYAIRVNDADATVTIWNTIMICRAVGTDSTGIYIFSSTATSLYGCTVISKKYGIRRGSSGGTVVAKNCYAFGDDTSAYSGTITMTNCAAEDTTADGTSPLDSVAYDTTEGAGHAGFTNVGVGTEDFHLKSGSALVGAGATLTDDPPGSTALGVDIAGTTRS